MTAAPKPIYVQVVEAIEAGCETSRDVAARLGMQSRLARAHISVARRLGMVEPFGKLRYDDSQIASIRWRAVR